MWLIFTNCRRLLLAHFSRNLARPSIEPRANQIFVPLLSIVEDDDAREELRNFARQCNEQRANQRRETEPDEMIWVPLDDGDAGKGFEGLTSALRR